jgi:hypothetical protein
MPGSIFQLLKHSITTLSSVACDLVRLLLLVARSRRALARREPLPAQTRPRFHAAGYGHSGAHVLLALPLGERQADTFLRWHGNGFRLFWRWKSRPIGRPQIPKDLRRLIREVAEENPTWGEERIANELQLKLTMQVSPPTVGKYRHRDGPVRTPDETALAGLGSQPCQGHGGLRLQ